MLDPSILTAQAQPRDTSIDDLITGLRQRRVDKQRMELQAAQTARQMAAQRVSENQLAQQQAAQQRAEQVRGALGRPDVKPGDLQALGDLDAAEKLRASQQQAAEGGLKLLAEKLKQALSENQTVANISAGVLRAKPEERAALYSAGLQTLGGLGVDVSKLPQQYSPDIEPFIKSNLDASMSYAQQLEALGKQQGIDIAGKTEERTATLFPTVQSTAIANMGIAQNTQRTGTPDPVTGLTREQQVRADREKMQLDETKRHNQRMESFQAMQKAEEKTKLSGEASKVLSVATTMLPELDKLEALFRDAYKTTVAGKVTGTNREVVRLIDNIADKVGRLRSGGAINKQEEERFLRQLGATPADLAFGTAEQAIEALRGVRAEAQMVSSRVSPSTAKPAATAPTAEPMAVGPNGEKIVLRGGKWVPLP